MYYIACYDLEDDQRRQRLFRLLKDYGTATQFSLFICNLDPELKQQLLKHAKGLLDATTDRFALYPLCSHCMAQTKRAGSSQPECNDSPVRVI